MKKSDKAGKKPDKMGIIFVKIARKIDASL